MFQPLHALPCGFLLILLGTSEPRAGSSRVVELEPAAPKVRDTALASWQTGPAGLLFAEGHALAPEVRLEEGLELSVHLPGAGRLRMHPLGVRVGARSLPPGPSKLVEASGSRLEVAETWAGIDEELELQSGAVKHDLLVSRAALEMLGFGELLASWRFEMPEGVSAALEGGEGLVLRSASGSFLGRVPQPLVSDVMHGHGSDEASLRWEGGVLSVAVAAAWLHDASRSFPLRIDPAITLFPSSDARTGWVDELGTKSSGAIDSGSLRDVGFGGDVRGFAEFDSSPIPDSATILDVRLRVWLSNHDNPDDAAVPLRMEVKAVNARASASAAVLHGAIPPLFAGTIYATENVPRSGASFCPDAFEVREYDLGPLADGELESKLPVDWFTIGFVSQIVTDPGFDHLDYIGFNETVNNGDCPTTRLPGSRIRLNVEYSDDLPPVCDPGGPYQSACPDAELVLDGSASFDPEGEPLTYSWTSDCDGVIEDADQALARLVMEEPCSASCTVTLTVEDSANASSCAEQVVLADTEDPVLEGVPEDGVAPCDELPPQGMPTASDDCDESPAVRYLGEERLDGDCPDRYTLRRSWQAEDRCGRLSEIGVQEIEVRDDEPPVLEGLPPDETVPCDEVPPLASPIARDDCDPLPNAAFLGEEREPGPCENSYTLRRRWQASDRCGNASEIAEQVLTVVDEEAPVIDSVPPDLEVSCDEVPDVPQLTASDDCDPAPRVDFLSERRIEGSCPDSYSLTRRWRAVDRCGNASPAVLQIVTVSDSQPPGLTGFPADETVACDALPALAEPGAEDDCDPEPLVDFLGETREDGPCPDSYTLRRSWQARDRCGNLSEVREQLITVVDQNPPVIDAVPPDVEVSCDEIPPVAQLTASDDCDPAPLVEFLSERRLDGPCPDSYRLTRRWRALDRCGNASAAVLQVVTVTDAQPPSLSGVPADAAVSCDAVPTVGSPSAADDCDPDPLVEYLDETREDGPCPDTYTLRRSWQARDRCGNLSAIEEQVLSVSDTQAPSFDALPAAEEVACDSVPGIPLLTASDDCDPAPSVEFLGETRSDGPCPDTYTLRRFWQARDRCGNLSAIAEQVLGVSDLVAPVLSGVPADVSVSCEAVPPVAVPGATDDCDPAPAVDFLGELREDGACPDSYTLRRRWQGRDRCGNLSAIEEQVIAVRDEEAPLLAGVPADATVECDAVPPPPAVSATDNCDPAPVTGFSETRLDGGCPGEYLLTRTWTAVDRCGNSSAQSQRMNVVDTTPPVVLPSTGGDLACLWPPNHRYLCFDLEDFAVELSEACSEPVTVELVGCESNQPDDARESEPGSAYNGDGHTVEDCVLIDGGRRVCVRAERAGRGPDAQDGRRYSLAVVAVDACGNRSAPTGIGSIHVPHDQSPAEDCIDSTKEGLKDKDLPR